MTDWIRHLEAKNQNHERLAELIDDNASDGKENLLHCKDIGLKTKAENSKKPKLKKSSPLKPTHLMNLSLNHSMTNINGRSMPDYLKDFHSQPKTSSSKKDLTYWKKKISSITKISQNDFDRIVNEIKNHDQKTGRLKNLVSNNTRPPS